MKKKPYYDKLFYLTQTTLYNKRNVSMKDYSMFQINNILQNDSCHLVALFKEYLIYLETSDFFRRYYFLSESYHRIQKLCEYYSLTSLLYPNYICIPEGKYIYKNIMKKQKIIDLLEAMNEKDSTRLKKKYKIKGMDDNKNNNKVFDTEVYESIAFKQNQSNINELFGLNYNNKDNNDMNSSFNQIDKLVSYINSFETNTYHMINTNDKVNTNSNMNKTQTAYNVIIPKKIHKIELSKNRLNIFHPYLNSNNPKLKLHLNINNTTTTTNKPTPKVVMPPIPLSKHLHTQNQNHNIRHKYLHSLPSELNSYRITYKKPESTIKRKPTQINNTTITLNTNNIKTNMNNTTTSNNKTITNKKTLSIITTSPLKLFDMKTNNNHNHNHNNNISSTNTKHISSHSNSKINKRIITSRNKLNSKTSLDNHYFTSGWLSERKSNKHYI